jgi:hypothetical protein
LELDNPNAPLTFAKPKGVGALQLSAALFQSGKEPHSSAAVLREMLLEFGRTRNLGTPSEVVLEDAPLKLAAASFRPGVLIRVWYVSDGLNFALATYNCELENERHGEVAECEHVVRSVRFA